MQTLFSRVAGMDIHKDTIVVCLRITDAQGKVKEVIRTFGTMTITARHAHDICRHARQLEICVLQYFVDAVHAPRVLCRQLSSLPSQVSQLTLLALRDMA